MRMQACSCFQHLVDRLKTVLRGIHLDTLFQTAPHTVQSSSLVPDIHAIVTISKAFDVAFCATQAQQSIYMHAGS